MNNNHNFNLNNPSENRYHHQNHQNQVENSCEENGLIKKSFSQKLARAFASLVQTTGHTSNTTSTTASENNSSNQATLTSPSSVFEHQVDNNAHQICRKNLEFRNEFSDEQYDRTTSNSKVTNNLTGNNAAIVKSTSLERNVNYRLTQGTIYILR